MVRVDGRVSFGPAGHRSAPRSPDRCAWGEHPSDAGHRLSSDQTSLLEEPRSLGVELLEGVVREDQGSGLFGDAQDESITPADGPGRRRDHLAVINGLFEGTQLGGVDAMAEGGVDHHDHVGRCETGVFLEKRADRLVELGQAGCGPTLGGDVRTVHDDTPAVTISLLHRDQSTI